MRTPGRSVVRGRQDVASNVLYVDQDRASGCFQPAAFGNRALIAGRAVAAECTAQKYRQPDEPYGQRWTMAACWSPAPAAVTPGQSLLATVMYAWGAVIAATDAPLEQAFAHHLLPL